MPSPFEVTQMNTAIILPVHRSVDLENQRKVGCVWWATHATAQGGHQRRVRGSRGSLPCHSLKECICGLGSAAAYAPALAQGSAEGKIHLCRELYLNDNNATCIVCSNTERNFKLKHCLSEKANLQYCCAGIITIMHQNRSVFSSMYN